MKDMIIKGLTALKRAAALPCESLVSKIDLISTLINISCRLSVVSL